MHSRRQFRLLFFHKLILNKSRSNYLIKNSKTKQIKNSFNSASHPSSICRFSHFPLRFNTLIKALIPLLLLKTTEPACSSAPVKHQRKKEKKKCPTATRSILSDCRPSRSHVNHSAANYRQIIGRACGFYLASVSDGNVFQTSRRGLA